jgi:hypothetical protein
LASGSLALGMAGFMVRKGVKKGFMAPVVIIVVFETALSVCHYLAQVNGAKVFDVMPMQLTNILIPLQVSHVPPISNWLVLLVSGYILAAAVLKQLVRRLPWA